MEGDVFLDNARGDDGDVADELFVAGGFVVRTLWQRHQHGVNCGYYRSIINSKAGCVNRWSEVKNDKGTKSFSFKIYDSIVSLR